MFIKLEKLEINTNRVFWDTVCNNIINKAKFRVKDYTPMLRTTRFLYNWKDITGSIIITDSAAVIYNSFNQFEVLNIDISKLNKENKESFNFIIGDSKVNIYNIAINMKLSNIVYTKLDSIDDRLSEISALIDDNNILHIVLTKE